MAVASAWQLPLTVNVDSQDSALGGACAAQARKASSSVRQLGTASRMPSQLVRHSDKGGSFEQLDI